MSTRLGKNVKSLLNKSREAAILAVEIYNKPGTKFKSHGYIVVMVIAWTSLFHAIFEKQGKKYFEKQKDSNRYIYIDGEKKSWDISKCIAEYFGNHNSPVKDNLKFIIGLRNRIEHRFLPALDVEVFGECQSLLFNYEKLILSEFGDSFSLDDSLSIPLQLLSIIPDWKEKVLREIQSKEYDIVRKYIDVYRGSLDPSVWENSQYSFRVFLIPKLGNRQKSSDVAIEFVNYDPTNSKDMETYQRLAAFIKEKQVAVINPNLFKPSEVCKKIKNALRINFCASTHHAKCWRYYQVRPPAGFATPEKTENKYCHYDVAHNDYLYTRAWIDFLLEELANLATREKILGPS